MEGEEGEWGFTSKHWVGGVADEDEAVFVPFWDGLSADEFPEFDVFGGFSRDGSVWEDKDGMQN